MRILLLCIVTLVLTIWACTPEEEELTLDASATIRFSTDSVHFDTLITSVQSITRRFRVYNESKNAVNIASIEVSGGDASPYRIYVNGRAGSSFTDTKLFGGDSLLVLVEAILEERDENTPFLVTDEIEFTTNGKVQDVKLVAWGQDAVFLNGEILPCNTTWTNERPYVIYNSVLVEEGCTLTVQPGAKIYSHQSSFILVEGTLVAEGTAANRIVFRNDRFDEPYENAPGQWGGLIFLEGSNENSILYSDIRNAEFGIYLGTPDDNDVPDLIVGNTRIENIGGTELFNGNIINVQPGYGLIAFNSDLNMFNTLINNCQLQLVANLAGGNYSYNHCTFSGFSFDFFRNQPLFTFSDVVVLADDSQLINDLNLEVSNSIIWGSLTDELTFSNSEASNFNVSFNHSILRTTNDAFEVNNNLLNMDPLFTDPENYDYRLTFESPAIGAASASLILTDLMGADRDDLPDIGAFEYIE